LRFSDCFALRLGLGASVKKDVIGVDMLPAFAAELDIFTRLGRGDVRDPASPSDDSEPSNSSSEAMSSEVEAAAAYRTIREKGGNPAGLRY
jgi:hypothetical protein